MGVYIKGMEMPTSCISCLLNFGEKRPEYGLTIYCPYSDGVISWRDKAFDNGRLASCGIVPVPPHGKLVEVADVKELFEKHFGDDQIAFQLIDSVPVIIPPKSKEQQDQEDLVERLNREGIAP